MNTVKSYVHYILLSIDSLEMEIAMYTVLHEFLILIVNYSILFFEFTGVIIIVIACLHGIYEYITRKSGTRLHLAKGMALGLEFKLGSEILRTVVVRSLTEILMVASIIALRALLTFLIHWEIKNEEVHQINETQNEN